MQCLSDVHSVAPRASSLLLEGVERENSSVESILSLQELCRFTTDFR